MEMVVSRESLSKGIEQSSIAGEKNENVSSNAGSPDGIELFESFVKYDENGACEASGILSAKCYEAWLSKQKPKPSEPRTAFRDEIFLHLTGSQGRQPFKREVETHLLSLLRVGVLGYHEMQQLKF